MKFLVQLHEACFVTWTYEVEAQSEEEAKRRVRKNAPGIALADIKTEAMAGYPTMLEIVGGPLAVAPSKFPPKPKQH